MTGSKIARFIAWLDRAAVRLDNAGTKTAKAGATITGLAFGLVITVIVIVIIIAVVSA